MSEAISVIQPDWPAPAVIKAATTVRSGGVSDGSWRGLNLGAQVGDEPVAVSTNRDLLGRFLKLPSEPCWLTQVHGSSVLRVPNAAAGIPDGDGSIASIAGTVCAVLTADCLPLLICSRSGDQWAAVHCGWRGLCSGIVAKAVSMFNAPADQLLAWMGPAIGPQSYQVGSELRTAFVWAAQNAEQARKLELSFVADPNADHRYLADLYRLTETFLLAAGVHAIYGGGFDTCTDSDRFFSYRRDGVTGRFATLIWRDH